MSANGLKPSGDPMTSRPKADACAILVGHWRDAGPVPDGSQGLYQRTEDLVVADRSSD